MDEQFTLKGNSKHKSYFIDIVFDHKILVINEVYFIIVCSFSHSNELLFAIIALNATVTHIFLFSSNA